jgi:hypothetical protein
MSRYRTRASFSCRKIALIPDFRSTNRSSCDRYAGLTFTSTAPVSAVATCRYTHSTQLHAHMPTRSPGRMPSPHNPRAVRPAFSCSSLVRKPHSLMTRNQRIARRVPRHRIGQSLADGLLQ